MKRMFTKWWGSFSIFILFLGIDLWKNYSSNASSFFAQHIAPLFDTVKMPLIVYIFFTIAIVQFFLERIKDIRNESAEELTLYIKANRQFSAYRRLELIQDVIRKFVVHQESVDAVQIYKYEIKKRPYEVIVKVQHVDGFVYEGIELNALGQIYFHIERPMYRDFVEARDYLERHHDATRLIGFVRFYRSRIDELTEDEEIGENEATYFAILQLAVDLIEEWFQEVFHSNEELNLFNVSQELFVKLNERKRTGILRAILLKDDYYRFSHYGTGEKQGRLYIGRHILLGGVNHCFLITLDPGIFYEENALEQIEDIQSQFINGIQKSLELVYNEATVNREGDRHEEAQ